MSAVAQEKYLDGVLAYQVPAERAPSGEIVRARGVRRDDALAAVITLPLTAVTAADQSPGHGPGCVCIPVPTSADEKWFYDRMHPFS